MGLLLALFIVIKYVCSIIFTGPLNFGIELLFWIISGVIFGPINGSMFSLLCDTFITMFTSGIAYWMIEYAIIAPMVSIISWFYFRMYKQKSKTTIYFSTSVIFIMLMFSIVVFYFQLINDNFKYEGIKNFSAIVAYVLIIFLTLSISLFTIISLSLFYIRKDWKYIKWIYYLSLLIFVVVIFRWIWGPYAYAMFYKRFIQATVDISKQYSLTLFGIVSKSYITIPVATIVIIPTLNVISFYNYKNQKNIKYM